MKTPGKEFGKLLIEAYNYWLTIPSDKLAVISSFYKTVHNCLIL